MAAHMEADPIPTPPPVQTTMEDFVRSLHRQLQETQQQNRELYQTMMEIRQQLSATPTSTTTTAASAPVVTPEPNTISYEKRPKPRLPKPEAFTGEDLSLYAQFELKLMAKLEIDAESIGSARDQLWYAFNLLDGKAAARIHPWMKIASESSYGGAFTIPDLVSQMRKAFLDPALQDKALLKLNTLKQGTRTLREFLSDFDRLLLEAGGLMWTDDVKKGYLRTAISIPILQGMVGTTPDASYERYCDQLRMIDDQLEQLRRITKGKTSTVTVQSEGGAQQVGDAMDWEATKVANVRTETRTCYGCGKKGHLKRNCKTTVSAAAATTPDTPAVVTTVNEEAGKASPSA